ncbi:MAG: PAS domain S-box protein [Bacteroidetes bacterium]|nr:PAS domain S-box protein [Bacteroidota bacterium]
MKKVYKSETGFLRQKALKIFKNRPGRMVLQLSETEALKLINELEVHKIELELQNEELMLAKGEAEVAADKFNELFDFAPISYFTLTKEGKIIDLNFCGTQMVGKERSLLKNNPFVSFVSKETKQIFNSFLVNVFKNQVKETCEVTLKDKFNKPIYVHLTGIVNENGEQCFVTASDITQRRQEEKALKDSMDNLNRLVYGIQAGVIIQGPKAEILLTNPKALELLGLDEALLLGKTSFDPDWNVIHEDGSPFPGSTHPVPVAIEKRQPIRDVVMGVFRPGKGDRVWLLVHAEPQLNKDGTVLQVVCSFSDITKRKRAENELYQLNEKLEERVKERTSELLKSYQELEQIEEKYRTVANYTYDWEYWINAEGSYNYVSPSCERITGYTVQEFMDDNELINKIIHPDDLSVFLNHVAQRFPTKDNKQPDFRIISKSGEIRWIGHTCIKIYVDGKYLGIRASNRDITEKVKAENEVLTIAIEVEERERNRFSRELHDGLGPLLSTIKLYFQWLAESSNTEKAKIIIEKGNYNIETAIQTTRELAYSLSPHILNDFGFVDAVLSFTQSLNETQKININFTFSSNDRFNNFLEINLFRITTELINNTLKYARATYVQLVFNYEKENRRINLSYIDNGIGFDLTETVQTSKGLGLLNIEQRIKILMGTLKFETAVGKGIHVYIDIPVNETGN